MSLHLVRLFLRRNELFNYARCMRLFSGADEDIGYLLHAWLKATFGGHAPKPFFFDEGTSVLLGYCPTVAEVLFEHASSFADPLAFQAFEPESLVSKPMPTLWPKNKPLRMDIRACPVSRKEDQEKDVFLRALDRWENSGFDLAGKPNRPEVYRDWCYRQLANRGVEIAAVAVTGIQARQHLARRTAAPSARRLVLVERPEAHFTVLASVSDSEAFNRLLARGVGRHRAFGFGMIRLAPAL